MASSIPAAATGGLSHYLSASRIQYFLILSKIGLRDEEGGGGGAGLFHGVGDVLEDGEVKMCRAGLLGVRATNDLCACTILISISIFFFSFSFPPPQ